MARAYWHMGKDGGLAIDGVLEVIFPDIRVVQWDEKSSNVKKMEEIAVRVDGIIGLPADSTRETTRAWQRSILSADNLRKVEALHGQVIDWSDPYLYRAIASGTKIDCRAELNTLRGALAAARK